MTIEYQNIISNAKRTSYIQMMTMKMRDNGLIFNQQKHNFEHCR